jgi:hypothetical protein
MRNLVWEVKQVLVSTRSSTHVEWLNVLAIHSICHAAMSGNAVPKVLDVESTLETRSKKATKWCDQGSETCHE